ncbi:diguanylate cyclase domain-containing protein [Pseudoduganella sp. RAF53_2]|uniref:diguanylate cyclase domain-containing protein n=1 Tax=unclassified Pseudoduganella TaxID=2637179 RepID=UPI003F967958
MPLTFRLRMALLVAGLVLLASGLVALALSWQAERHMRADIGAQQETLLASAAAYIDHDLSAKRELLQAQAERIGPDVSPRQLQTLMEHSASLRGAFFNVVAIDAQGELFASLRDRRDVGHLNVSNRPYFQQTVAMHEGVISAPFRSALSEKPVVLVTEPVFDAHGELRYILGGAIELEGPGFFGQIEALQPGEGSYLFMLDQNGTIAHHPDHSLLLRKVGSDKSTILPSAAAAVAGFEGWTDGVMPDGQRVLVSYKRLLKSNWIIGAVYPEEEALAPVLAMRRHAVAASAVVALVCGAFGLMAARLLIRPLLRLRHRAARVTAGLDDIHVFDTDRRDEFGDLSRTFYALTSQRAAAQSKLAELALSDPLTGTANRRKFEESLPQAIARAGRAGQHIALAYLDVDYFKSINDTLGHASGDEVLCEFAHRLHRAVRSTDLVARLGGDEFVVVFEQLADEGQVAQLGEHIMTAMRTPFECGGRSIRVTTSVGFGVASGAGTSADALLSMADEALYAAKAAGRDGWVVCSEGEAGKVRRLSCRGNADKASSAMAQTTR